MDTNSVILNGRFYLTFSIPAHILGESIYFDEFDPEIHMYIGQLSEEMQVFWMYRSYLDSNVETFSTELSLGFDLVFQALLRKALPDSQIFDHIMVDKEGRVFVEKITSTTQRKRQSFHYNETVN